MHVLMLGAGAMGSLLSARFSRTASRVTLFSTNHAHMQAIREGGLAVEELDGTVPRYALTAIDRPDEIAAPVDLVLVVVKSYATQAAVASIATVCQPSTLFLTLQNGVGNWERIAEAVGRERILVGSTAQGATLLGPGRIRHGGNGPTFIGEPHGAPTARIDPVVALFREAGFDTRASDRMEQLIWEKLMVNVGINAITALAGIRNGFIAENVDAQALCRAAVEEAAAVARAKGFDIRGDIVERVLAVARATAVNRSSMGQDVDRRKRTEIDAINGAIVRFGAECGIDTPVNRTLTQLVKILEASYA